jgi:hypothetical protein
VSFFEPLPSQQPPPRRPRQPPWTGPPSNEVPVGVPGGLLLARSEAAAVSAGSFRVYSTGFELTVTALVRPGEGAPPHVQAHRQQGVPIDEVLRLGIRCADGSAAEVDRGYGRRERPDGRPERVLWSRGGGGSDARWSFQYWSWPLPPPGPIELLCLWPRVGIAESSGTLDAAPILEAAARVEPLWPEQDDAGGSSSTSSMWSRYGP